MFVRVITRVRHSPPILLLYTLGGSDPPKPITNIGTRDGRYVPISRIAHPWSAKPYEDLVAHDE